MSTWPSSKFKNLLNRHLKLYLSNKTANINGKNVKHALTSEVMPKIILKAADVVDSDWIEALYRHRKGKGMHSHENHRTPVKCAFRVRSGTEILPCSMAQTFPCLWAQRYRSVPAEHISMTSGLPRPLLLYQTCWMLMTDMTEPMCLWRSHPKSHICRFFRGISVTLLLLLLLLLLTP